MTQAQQSALEALAGRGLTVDELAQIDALLPERNDVAIAAVLSLGRTALMARNIDERGIRAALPVTQASPFLALLKSTAAAETIPDWLSLVLTKSAVPEADQAAYFDTFACAYPWLQQEAGIDLGSTTTRAMLDMIAFSDPATYSGSVTALKALGQRDDPVPYNAISDALNVAGNLDVL